MALEIESFLLEKKNPQNMWIFLTVKSDFLKFTESYKSLSNFTVPMNAFQRAIYHELVFVKKTFLKTDR